MLTQLDSVLKALPLKPGIYLFKNAQDEVIYVGKASNLRNRVNSYFQQTSKLPEKTRQLVSKVDKIEFVITESEVAALVLECQQIKKYRPHFNVLLKDDKSFPYIKIDVKSPWPTISITRKRYNDGAKYIGRIPSAWSARQTFDLIKKIFPLRSCNRIITGKELRPCLKFHIKRCLSPCTGSISQKEYHDIVRQVVAFLEGKEEQVLRELKGKMKKASTSLQFEKAARLRDQINAIQDVIQSHSIPFNIPGELDVVALTRDHDLACVQLFSISDRRLKSDEHYIIEGVGNEDDSQIIESFIKQYYSSSTHVPKSILIPFPIGDSRLISEWLYKKRGSTVTIKVPSRGTGLRLLQIVSENAKQQLNIFVTRRLTRPESIAVLNSLKDKLQMVRTPQRIEGYDISNIQGNLAVGSMVVFENGASRPSQYRRFRIKLVQSVDDYAMMREMLQRRFKSRAESDNDWSVTPDLIMIDGGKGHLNAAVQAIESAGKDNIPVISIAKENEEVFLPGKSAALDLDKSSAESHLLQKIRDEAHRFAITYHRKLRGTQGKESALDSIEGIGSARKKALIKRFGSVKNIRQASLQDLVSVKGITVKLAQRIMESLA